MRFRLQILPCLTALLLLNSVWAADLPESHAISEFIVHYKDSAQTQSSLSLSGAQRAMDMGARIGESLAHVRATSDGHQVLRINRTLSRAQAWAIVEKLKRSNPDIGSIEPIDPNAAQVHGIDPIQRGGPK